MFRLTREYDASLMAKLTDIPLRLSYRTGRDDLVGDFFNPCLGVAVLYRRAAGYFTSAGLALAARGVASLISRGGKMQLVVSPYLEPSDVEALRKATDNPVAALQAISARSILDIEEALIKDRLNALAWLAAAGLLEIKLALRLDPQGGFARGIYHEKVGIFTDNDGNHVAFAGSSNETAGGLLENFESIKVFCSWRDPDGRVREEIENFGTLWADRTPGLRTIDFSSAGSELLARFKNPNKPLRVGGSNPDDLAIRTEMEVRSLWPHQQQALKKFLENKHGVIEMATGTGKTRLALAACLKLVSESKVSTIIVTADGTDLLDQWHSDLLKLVNHFKPRWAVYRHYAQHKHRDRFVLEPEHSVLLTSRLFLAQALKGLSSKTSSHSILIQDEVHRLGSPANREALSGLGSNIGFRMGLSATPDREYDTVGNDFIKSEIGDVIFRFGLEEAISQGILSPFQYHPIGYEPSDEDRARIQAVHARKAIRAREGNPMSNEELWTEIAKVYKTSKAKLAPFRQFIASQPDLLTRCIVFVETKEYGEEVIEIIHAHHHEFHTYFAEEDAETLKRFAAGEIECLVTCHRLSEGIDIRSLSSVILFSSSRTKLETIQRMGRCLRVDPSNPSKLAHVADFIRTDSDATPDRERADWLIELSKIRPKKEGN